MAKRDSDSGGMSLDSLMDTLTNVVGILLIILIFTVLSGADAMKRIKGFVDEISVQQLRAAIAKAESLRKLLEQQQIAWKEIENQAPLTQMTPAQQRELLAQLKADLAKLSGTTKVDLTGLKKELEQRRGAVKKVEDDIVAKEKEIASLQARLAATPAAGPAPDAKVVNLPDPREAPKDSKPMQFLCRYGRVVPLDVPAIQARAQQVVQTAAKGLFRNNRIDCEKMAGLFEKRFVGDRYCQAKVRIGGDAKPYLTIDVRSDVGDKTETISKPLSQFHRWIKNVDPQKTYLEFLVFSDSFETYIEARNVAARQGILAGWSPIPAKGEHWVGFGIDYKMTCMGKEPPKPTQPAAPPDPNRPPPPRDVID